MAVFSEHDVAKHRGSPVRRTWFWLTCQFLMGCFAAVWFRFRAVGLEHIPPTGGALLLANHASFLDPLLVGLPLQRPISFLARDTLFKIPLIGLILRITHVVPLNREGGSAAAIRETVHRVEEGYLVGIFPEGTRSADGRIGRLKPGFAAILRRTELPVLPVGIAGTHRALGRGSWFLKPAPVCVVYGPPLSPETLAQLNERGHEKELVELVRSHIATCLQEAEEILAGRCR